MERDQEQPPYGGALGFHAEESAEVIGMWRVNEKGEQERMW